MENPDRNAVVKVEDCDESFEFGCEVGIEESHDLCGTSQELEIQEDLAKKPESNCSCNGSGAQYNIGIGKAEHVSVGSPACQNGGPQQKASAGSESSVPGEEDQETSQTPGTTVEVKSSTGMIQIHLTIVNVQSDRVLNQGQWVEEALRFVKKIVVRDKVGTETTVNAPQPDSEESPNTEPGENVTHTVSVNEQATIQLSIRTPKPLGKQNIFGDVIGNRKWISPLRWVVTIASLCTTILLIFLFVEGLKHKI